MKFSDIIPVGYAVGAILTFGHTIWFDADRFNIISIIWSVITGLLWPIWWLTKL